MDIRQHLPRPADFFTTRRQFLNRFGMGFGALSLSSLLGAGQSTASAVGSQSPLAAKPGHFPGTAKRVIHIFSQGGPSHVDTWDPKPELAKYAGKEVEKIGGMPLPTQFKFEKKRQSGIEIS